MKFLAWGALILGASAAFPAFATGSLADLGVYDRTDGRRLQVHWHEGKAYVVGRPGNEYKLALRNRSGEDLLAVVSVDGVNVVTGETAEPSQSGYVLGPGRSFDVLGWRKSLAQTAAFYFTRLPDSYAARTGRPDNVGVIGVALFKRKAEPVAIAPAPQERSQVRPDAGATADAARQAESRIGTGHGRPEASQVRTVDFERASPVPSETLVLYYDSYRNLLARGVIRERSPVAPLPRPFPGFVPDPA